MKAGEFLKRNILQRIYRAAVVPEFKMEMRACTEFAGVTDDGDDFSGFYIITYTFQKGRVVLVKRHQIISVLYADNIPCFGSKTGHDHRAIESGFYYFIWT